MLDCGEFFKHREFTIYQHHENNLAYRAESHSRLQLVWLNLHTLNIIQSSLDILISGKNIFTFFKDSKFVSR